ncbi:MAG TPA: signal peptidase II [Anaerolinea thermolimosa]|uniref:Lipoprotein signal peptidase n=1 Tax=Anaerolinea thermolimosa TaxID=229919 RepID=A0A3D1JCX6_9CHLR|nr:signal peptidase II [Anaerolinea thermolimosa]
MCRFSTQGQALLIASEVVLRICFSLVKWRGNRPGGVSLKNFVRNYLILICIAGGIIVLDQFTKALVRQSLALGEIWSPWPWLTPYARIVHWYNSGVAFGLFQGKGDIFMILAILVALAIIYFYPRVPASDWSLRLAMGLQLGGAVGNLIDRLTLGHVTDFISVGTFPVFNVADSSITIGVIILLLGVYLQERKEKSQSARREADPPTGDPHIV